MPFESTEEPLRIFTRVTKDECWKKAKIVDGRDPGRWKRDAVGNIVCNKLRNCEGCLCHEYDHIIPFSRGGSTTLDNCQILQTRVNRYKGNEPNDPVKLLSYSCEKREYTSQELDLVEIALYGSIKRPDFECRVLSLFEKSLPSSTTLIKFSQKKPKTPPCPW